jgi:uncharacterized protein
MDLRSSLQKCEGFEWDAGTSQKNWEKHRVSKTEAEQVFFNHPLVVGDDQIHSSDHERRFVALGQTDFARKLTIVFTIRKKVLIRVISARDMSKKERNWYEEKEKNPSI